MLQTNKKKAQRRGLHAQAGDLSHQSSSKTLLLVGDRYLILMSRPHGCCTAQSPGAVVVVVVDPPSIQEVLGRQTAGDYDEGSILFSGSAKKKIILVSTPAAQAGVVGPAAVAINGT
jgi:hypothetical protein